MAANPTQGMGRKPVDLVASGANSTMDIMWATMRRMKVFMRKDLTCQINRTHRVNDDTVKSYLQRLRKGGYLQVIKTTGQRGARREFHYQLVKDTGIDAPRLAKDGTPTQQGKGREQMWRTMRILGDFDYQHLALAASTEAIAVKPVDAKDYIKHLYAVGYLHEVKPCQRGPAPLSARYRLLPSQFTGPRPPQVQRVKQVWDPNLGQVMPKINKAVRS